MSTYSVRRLNSNLGYDERMELCRQIIKDEFPGFQQIDDGAFALVYSKPRSRTVVKFAFNDVGYTKFAQYCAKHQDNPWLPRIKSVRLYIGAGNEQKLTVVVMERLKPVSYGKPGYDFASLVRKYVGEYAPTTAREEDQLVNDLLPFCKTNDKLEYLRKIRSFLKLVVARSNRSRDYDLHDQNVMRRGRKGLIVITDPLC